MSVFFLSYALEDFLAAQLCRKRIEAAFPKVEVRWDAEFGPSSSLEAIQPVLQTCSFFIVIWSEHARRSPWVVRQALEAVELGKPIINVIAGAGSAPYGFRSLEEFTPDTFIAGIRRTELEPGPSPDLRTLAKDKEDLAAACRAYRPFRRTLAAASVKRGDIPRLARKSGEAGVRRMMGGPGLPVYAIPAGVLAAAVLAYGSVEAVTFGRLAAAGSPEAALSVSQSVARDFGWTFAGRSAPGAVGARADRAFATARKTATSSDPAPLAKFVSEWSAPALAPHAGELVAQARSDLTALSSACYVDRLLDEPAADAGRRSALAELCRMPAAPGASSCIAACDVAVGGSPVPDQPGQCKTSCDKLVPPEPVRVAAAPPAPPPVAASVKASPPSTPAAKPVPEPVKVASTQTPPPAPRPAPPASAEPPAQALPRPASTTASPDKPGADRPDPPKKPAPAEVVLASAEADPAAPRSGPLPAATAPVVAVPDWKVEPYTPGSLYVGGDFTMFRDEPTTEATVLMTRTRGDEITVTGRVAKSDGAWYEVKLPGGRKGYVQADLLARSRPRSVQ